MTWNTLSAEQRAFLEKHLNVSFLDIVRDKHSTDDNKAVIETFEAYEALRILFDQNIAVLPDDYPEKIMIQSQADDAAAKCEDGDFEGASAIIGPAIQEIQKTRAFYTTLADEIRPQTVPVVIAGITGAETTRLNGLRQVIDTALAQPLPNKADLTTAQTGLPPYLAAVAKVTQAAADRAKLRLAFDTAFATAKAKLAIAAALDATNYLKATSSSELTEQVARAKDIKHDAEVALASDDPDLHRAATAKLDGWNADQDVVETARLKAAGEIKDELGDLRDKWKAYTDSGLTADLSRFGEADRQKILAIKAEVDQIYTEVASSLSGADTASHLVQFDSLESVRAKFQQFKDAVRKADNGLVKDYFASKGVAAAHQDGIVDLYNKSPQSYNKASTILESTSAVLGDVEVTREFLKDKKQAAETARNERSEAWKVVSPLLTSLKDKDKVLGAQQAEIKALKDQVATADSEDPATVQKQAALDLLKQEHQVLVEEHAAQYQVYQEKRATYNAARSTSVDADKIAKAADTQKRMLDALSFGPLSPEHGRAMSDDVAAELLGVYEKDAETADRAVTIACQAKNPESVAKCATLVGDLVQNGFKTTTGKAWNENYSRSYAGNLMDMTGNFDPSVVDDLKAYLDGDHHRDEIPALQVGTTSQTRTKGRTEHVGSATLNSDGAVDVTAGRRALQDVMFHPKALRRSTPVQAVHMMETLNYFEGSSDACDLIAGTTAPESDVAKGLMARSTGKSPDSLGKADTQAALINAMMTPVYQGAVGSCFATAGIILMRQDYPLDTLEVFEELATKGSFSPVSGDPVPAVQNVPIDEDPLVRSLEYSAATACAQTADSGRRKDFNGAMKAGTGKFTDKIKNDKWLETQAKIETAVSDAVTFIYNPEAELGTTSSDGSSKKGRYQMINKATKTPIDSREEFIAAIKPVIAAAVTAESLKEGATAEEIDQITSSSEFIDALKVEDKFPWQLPSGGQPAEASKTLFGGDPQTCGFLNAADSDTSDAAARTTQILGGILERYGNRSDEDMATIRTVGKHSFNTLPSHDSLTALTDGGPTQYAANIQTNLIDKGQAMKDTDIPPERAAYMFDQALAGYLEKAEGETRIALEAAMATHRPTTELKPAAFQALLKTATTEYLEKKAKAEADAWLEKERAKSQPSTPETPPVTGETPEPTGSTETPSETATTDPVPETPPDPLIAKHAEMIENKKKRGETQIENGAMNQLMQALGAPEFMIADTNWGSGKDHTFFVVAPDPATGNPQMYKKKDPPGTLTPVTKDWVDAQWAQVE